MIFDGCDLQEVDPGQSSYEQTHAGLQHKRPRHKGLRWNHWHHFLFCQQAEDLGGGSGDSWLVFTCYIWPSVSYSVLKSESHVVLLHDSRSVKQPVSIFQLVEGELIGQSAGSWRSHKRSQIKQKLVSDKLLFLLKHFSVRKMAPILLSWPREE